MLKNINLKLLNAGMVSILGKSGSGKSTLLNILGCIDQVPTAETDFTSLRVKDESGLTTHIQTRTLFLCGYRLDVSTSLRSAQHDEPVYSHSEPRSLAPLTKDPGT